MHGDTQIDCRECIDGEGMHRRERERECRERMERDRENAENAKIERENAWEGAGDCIDSRTPLVIPFSLARKARVGDSLHTQWLSCLPSHHRATTPPTIANYKIIIINYN